MPRKSRRLHHQRRRFSRRRPGFARSRAERGAGHRRRIRLRQVGVNAGRDGPASWTAKVAADRMEFDGIDLLAITPRERRRIIGNDMAMIFQEPMSSLNPCYTVGFQLTEALKVHLDMGKAERRARAIDLLRQVGIADPERRLGAFPQLSGGMSQRVMIAMAISCNPRLLIADSRPPRSTSPFRRRSSTSCSSCSATPAWASCSSPTIWASSPRPRSASRFTSPARRSRSRMSSACSPTRIIPTPPRCLLPSPSAPMAAASLDTGRRSRPVRSPDRLSLLAALPQRRRILPHCRAEAGGPRARRCALPLPAACRCPARSSRTRGRRMSEAPVLVATDLARYYHLSRGVFRPHCRAEGPRRRFLHPVAPAHLGGRRRVRLRQVDPCPPGLDDRGAVRRLAAHRR